MKTEICINENSKTPVYKQIIESIIDLVNARYFKENDLLPSMNELSVELGISKETIKKAYSILRERGVIHATQGKGFYISKVDDNKKINILLLFDKLSTYKQVLFSSFESHIDSNVEITIRLHNQDIDLFEQFVDENLDLFDYYVITPHFPLMQDIQKRLLKTLKRIPNRKLLLLDVNIEKLPGNFGAVYQDFKKDVHIGLMQGIDKLKRSSKLNVITMPTSLYGSLIIKGVEEFCSVNKINVEFHHSITPEIIRKKEIYLILNGQLDIELIELVRYAKQMNYKIGKDIGIISYNESPINEIILNGLTTISTDFNQMGKLAAQMINEKALRKVRCEFRMTRRNSF
ncbi:GntR family transcriptional regulator [Parabacteroides sp. Marseille-P3160]|uniref:GntR family transcriptional regulator n=1 Tax=Parabacteroides sp. Marseille-P3160 TaxID=1917887 RepID=UPI0009BBC3EA|nr:GntR family transcriptional regulator [Parabacteroides sp. Marseille-P3160]